MLEVIMNFPFHKSDRRVIIVLDDREYDTEQELSKSRKTLFDQEGVACLPYSIIKSENNVHNALQTLIDDDLITKGQILIQNPYDKERYVRMIDAEKNLFIEKWQLFSTFCGVLGAKKVSVETIETIVEESDQNANFKAEGIVHGANISSQKQSKNSWLNEKNLENKFDGATPDIEKAEKFLRIHHLQSDMNLRSLIRMREGHNPLKEHTLKITLGEEFKDSFDLAFSLKLPAASLGISYKQATSRLQKSVLTVKVIF